MLQKDTIKIFIEISPFFGVKTSKTFKTYNDIQIDSQGRYYLFLKKNIEVKYANK